jgi:activator of HSP90 ATPase
MNLCIVVSIILPISAFSPQDFPTLGKIFNLEKILTVAPAVAAVFGFLPNLLINVLQQQANNWQIQIQSNSQASQGSNANSGSDDSGSGSSDSSSNSSAANSGAGQAVG